MPETPQLCLLFGRIMWNQARIGVNAVVLPRSACQLRFCLTDELDATNQCERLAATRPQGPLPSLCTRLVAGWQVRPHPPYLHRRPRQRAHAASHRRPPLAAGRRLLLALWLFAACKARPLALSKYGVDDVFAARHLPQQCLVTLQLCCGNPRDVKKRLQVRHCSSFFVRLRFVCFFLVCARSSDAVPVNSEGAGRRPSPASARSPVAARWRRRSG